MVTRRGGFYGFLCDINSTLSVFWVSCHSERSEESREHPLYASEILPPFGRLNDSMLRMTREEDN